MNEQKSFIHYIVEAIDRYRIEQRARASEQGTQSRMPRRIRRLLRWLTPNGGSLLLVLVLIAAAQVWAKPLASPASPGPSATTVNYQGRLTDSAGAPLNGTYGMTFALYDAATDGSLVWGPEEHTAVEVSNGLFSVGLGSKTQGGIPTTTWNGDRYLEITVSGETLSPRELIRSVPIAGMALTVPDGSIGAEKIADEAVTLEKLGLAKYYVQGGTNDDPSLVRYTGPSGQETTLDTASCSAEEWCCNAEKTICYHQKSDEDAIMEFSLEGAPSYVCMLLHSEDDDPDMLYYATDGGNQCHTKDGWCARLSNAGITSSSPVRKNRNFYWLCGW